MSWQEFLGIIAPVLIFIGLVPYVLTILKGTVKPHIFTWVIFTIITAVAFLAQINDGAGLGAYATLGTCIACATISILCCFKGDKRITRSDWVMFFAALATIPIWLATQNPLWSVILIVIIDACAVYPTLRKSYIRPHEEMMFPFFIDGVAFIFAIIALESYSLVTALYPAFIVFADWGLCIVIYARRRTLSLKKHD